METLTVEGPIIPDNAQSAVSFESYLGQYEHYEQGDCIVLE